LEQAQRLQAIPPYPFAEIARLKDRALAEGWDLIDFGIGDPDLPPPGCAKQALASAIEVGPMNNYDESSYGLPAFLESVSTWFGERFGVDLDPKGEVKVTIGSKEALAKAAWAYIDTGDVSLVPTPGYGVYTFNTQFAGGEAYAMPLLAEAGYLPDLDAIPEDIAGRAKLLYLNYPHNPTGAVATEEFFKRAIEFAEKHDILICNDAAYSELYYGHEAPPSILAVDGGMERAIEFHSFSKTYCMTGWRLGWVCGSRDGVAGVSRMKSYVDSNVFPALQQAGAVTLARGGDHARMVRDVYQSRRDTLVEGLRSIGWPVDPPQGTFFVWAPSPKGMTSADASARILSEAHVITIPGSSYGEYGEGFIRFSLTLRADDVEARIAEAIARISRLGLSFG
jgi:LL-diaminopimelate aminotransferase